MLMYFRFCGSRHVLHITWWEIDNTKKTHTFSDSPVGTTYDIAMYTQIQTDELDKFEYTIVLNSWVNLDQFWDLETETRKFT